MHIKCPSKALWKRQFTMHVVFNAGTRVRRKGQVNLVCKGTVKRVRQVEKDLWNKRVDAYFQKNIQLNTEVMRDIAAKFASFKVQSYRANKQVLLYCDNLRAYLADDTKKIFSNAKVFLHTIFLPT